MNDRDRLDMLVGRMDRLRADLSGQVSRFAMVSSSQLASGNVRIEAFEEATKLVQAAVDLLKGDA